MKILLLSPLFQPEPNHLKGLAFARELSRRGHCVQVLTGFPHYPEGKVYKGYKIKWRVREVMDGIDVIRVAHYPSHDQSGFKRIVNFFSFGLSAASIGLFSVRRPDVIHVYGGLVTMMIPAIVMKLVWRVRILLDIQDLWPDSVASSGMFNLPGGMWILHHWCKLNYAVSDHIVVLSHGYKEILVSRGVDSHKITVVYNWCDEGSIANLERDERIGEQFGLNERFNVIFAGTMGILQALEPVIDAVSQLAAEIPKLQLVLVGGGVDVTRLQGLVSERGISNTKFIRRQPASDIAKILAFADVLLVHLRTDLIGQSGIPQKIQAYLAAGKPILAAVAGESAEIVKAAHAGIACMPENSVEIASAIRQLFLMPVPEREALGRNGQQYYRENLSFMKGVSEIMSVYAICVNGESKQRKMSSGFLPSRRVP